MFPTVTMPTYKGQPIPPEIYYGVPPGWTETEILKTHQRLGGTFDLRGPEVAAPAAPGISEAKISPDRREWSRHSRVLCRIPQGIRAGDPACIELAIRYIELRHIGFYSGYVRTRLARVLKTAALTEDQRRRLHEHFRRLYLDRDWSGEFAEYLRLWRRIIQPQELAELLHELARQPQGNQRASWLQTNLTRPDHPAAGRAPA